MRLGWRSLSVAMVGMGAVVAVMTSAIVGGTAVNPLDPVPATSAGGRLERRATHVVLRVAGTPEEMGRQHGALLRNTINFMLRQYIRPNLEGEHGRRLVAGVRRVRASLPEDYVRELDACATAAGVDADELLIAQCLGDLEVAIIGVRDLGHACTSYAAFGPATVDGGLQCGRNFDYDVGEQTSERASLVSYYSPEQGYRFASVGLAGVLGGWTLVNEKGLIVANHLGGGIRSRLDGIPTLILTRLVAQRAGTVEEAVRMISELPRVRGQIVWVAQAASADGRRPARAVAVEYDAARAVPRESEDGLLVVTNENRVFSGPPSEHLACGRYRLLMDALRARTGKLGAQEHPTLMDGVLSSITLHSVELRPALGSFDVWFRLGGRMQESPVRYELPGAGEGG